MLERIEYLPVDDALPPLQVGLCSLRQRLRNPLVQSFWDVAAQTYAAV